MFEADKLPIQADIYNIYNIYITLQLKDSDRKVVDVLHELMLPTPSGEMVPLSTVASFAFAGSIGDINRINNKRGGDGQGKHRRDQDHRSGSQDGGHEIRR